ncbi:hypothetical protein CNYM01_12638 [Colletotrichum nymphaeae SA-01]|uniref:Uncharacterized protein n=1 Tax=Colletotrichum nymphaeae SA-01 TaxID=1460502 RepID=A0A135ST92_9PEZI|nr:hypothetical protein CNYM01_12638 [Colletotrichum nymphaeae SA-01]
MIDMALEILPSIEVVEWDRRARPKLLQDVKRNTRVIHKRLPTEPQGFPDCLDTFNVSDSGPLSIYLSSSPDGTSHLAKTGPSPHEANLVDSFLQSSHASSNLINPLIIFHTTRQGPLIQPFHNIISTGGHRRVSIEGVSEQKILLVKSLARQEVEICLSMEWLAVLCPLVQHLNPNILQVVSPSHSSVVLLVFWATELCAEPEENPASCEPPFLKGYHQWRSSFPFSRADVEPMLDQSLNE